MKRKRKKLKVIYHGDSFEDAEVAGLLFWQRASIKAKLQAMLEFIEEDSLIKGLAPNAQRLLRTTAVIRLP